MRVSSGAICNSRLRRVDLRVAIATSASVMGVGGEPSLIMSSEELSGEALYTKSGLSRDRYLRRRERSVSESCNETGRIERSVLRV